MNRLSKETSPYLLQHAHNPVDWFPWGEEALHKARTENKPILLSIGYSTCHWCHVMERESFEDPRVAEFMNEYFVNIKLDREERPDIDSIYMEVAQAISGSGGWPLNCFLLPDGRAFFAGTYFPPRPAHGRPSWMQLLNNIRQAYYTKREEVEQQAQTLMSVLQESSKHFVGQRAWIGQEAGEETVFDKVLLKNAYAALLERFDSVHGGFGAAPKFPSVPALRFCLQYDHFFKEASAVEHLHLSLRRMIQGGIYDQLGGGFARYATDDAWLVPHFEKMLYDNALLLRLLSDAYAHTKEVLYGETIAETVDWVQRQMSSPEGGFYSAIDADSEGVEGKYYVWQPSEIQEILGDDAALFCAFYDVSEQGNWEGSSILNRPLSYEEFAQSQGMDPARLKDKLRHCRRLLLAKRNHRIAPGIDEKILLDWNALMISALCKAHRATANPEHRERAVRAARFIERSMTDPQSRRLWHSYKDGQAKQIGFLDDYATWIEALIQLYFSTFDEKYLEDARFYTDMVLSDFLDTNDKLLFFTPVDTELIVRKKDLYDNATPSGNALMVHNLQRLAALLDRWDYREQAQNMLLALLDSIQKYPLAFGHWCNALFWECCPTHEIAIVGKEYWKVLEGLNNRFFPNAVVAASAKPEVSSVGFLDGRKGGDETWIYVCQQGACQLPVQSIDAMLEQLEN